jgi:acylphosphatase
METIRVRACVRGRVQGVWFRASACERAEELGVVGWVRNRADGAVELEAEGARAAVDALVAWCRRGPAGAKVDALELEPIDPSGGEGFVVHH